MKVKSDANTVLLRCNRHARMSCKLEAGRKCCDPTFLERSRFKDHAISDRISHSVLAHLEFEPAAHVNVARS